jgi:hypothetical protein
LWRELQLAASVSADVWAVSSSGPDIGSSRCCKLKLAPHRSRTSATKHWVPRWFARSRKAENFARHAGFAVSLSGAGTRTVGVILCNQARVIDLQARQARFIEKAPGFIVDEVLARLGTLID